MEHEITALKAQKRNSNRINVYLDGEFAFGLARIVAAWLRVGQVLSDEKIVSLRAQDDEEVAFQRAVHYLDYKPRSEAEVARKLKESGFEPDVVEAVISRLKRVGFVGDEQFAAMWVENRTTFRPRSHRMMAVELRRKGVSDEAIENALTNAEDEEILAFQAAVRYQRRLEGLDWKTFRNRLSGYLGRRGFSYGIVAPVVQQIWADMHSGDGDRADCSPKQNKNKDLDNG